jgi:hypothetical protein
MNAATNEETPDEIRNSKIQRVIKKFFETGGESHKAYKTNEINCLTGDCRVLTAKISKNQFNSLFIKL